MPGAFPLIGGAYAADSFIANAQRCVNLYPEKNTEDAPMPVTHYPTPGLVARGTPPQVAPVRGLWKDPTGALYAVIGTGVYYVDENFTFTLLGSIPNKGTPVSFSDNGIDVVLVDGTENKGWTINITTRVFTEIADSAFYGADRVDYTDTYLIFNKPGTRQFYCTNSNIVTPFDPLYFASKTAKSDLLQTVFVQHRELWLIGEQTSEAWYLSGAAAFPFQIISGVFVEHGCAAKYSVAGHDLSIFFLSKDKEGRGVVLMLTQYMAKRISTHAIENDFNDYQRLDDAVGFTYQQNGHVFYVLSFPSADKTWVYDMTTGLWHERVWIDENGEWHRHRANCVVHAYNKTLVGDWENGQLYEMDPNTYTDNGNPVVRLRSWPHAVKDGVRVEYHSFMARVECGNGDGQEIFLKWSLDGGKRYGNAVAMPFGQAGEYEKTPTWQGGLGVARDMVFELSWSAGVKTALNGAYVEASPLGS
jgi:hypothetical protein